MFNNRISLSITSISIMDKPTSNTNGNTLRTPSRWDICDILILFYWSYRGAQSYPCLWMEMVYRLSKMEGGKCGILRGITFQSSILCRLSAELLCCSTVGAGRGTDGWRLCSHRYSQIEVSERRLCKVVNHIKYPYNHSIHCDIFDTSLRFEWNYAHVDTFSWKRLRLACRLNRTLPDTRCTICLMSLLIWGNDRIFPPLGFSKTLKDDFFCNSDNYLEKPWLKHFREAFHNMTNISQSCRSYRRRLLDRKGLVRVRNYRRDSFMDCISGRYGRSDRISWSKVAAGRSHSILHHTYCKLTGRFLFLSIQSR